MSYRFMRILCFFDLPVETPEDRRNYRAFRRLLINNGFMMMQKSVYCKLMTTPSVEASVKRFIRENKPPEGVIQLLPVTEKQFSRMEFVIGRATGDLVDSEERLVIL